MAHTPAISPGGGISDETIARIRADGIQAVLLFMPSETGGTVVSKLRTACIGVSIYSVSYLDAGTLVATAGRQHPRGVAISQAVPNPYRISLQIVRDYQRDMAALRSPAPNLSPSRLKATLPPGCRSKPYAPQASPRQRAETSKLRSGAWTFKFRSQGQLYLLGYTLDDQVRLVYLEVVGPHENFYRDLKRR